jgi:D-glycero-beta-D-manno-heptose-7-phosphate kinase
VNKADIEQLFARFSSLTVLVIGDVMIDAYLWGRVDRISPEAPVPVVHVQQKENRLGGAANVALNVKALGARAIICSVVGDGSKGDIFRKTSKESGFTTEGIIDSTERMTTVKTRVIAQGQQIVRVDEEITRPLSATDERNLIDCISQILRRQKIDAIIFEDYNKGVLTARVIETVLAMARERGILTAVDPKRDNFFAYAGCTMFKPNLKELREGLQRDIDRNDPEDLHSAMQDLTAKLQNAITMVTLSEAGVATLENNHFTHLSAHPREIVDVSGAGDTVISVAALALASGWNAADAACIANLAGGLVCEHIGVVPVDRARLQEETIKAMAK